VWYVVLAALNFFHDLVKNEMLGKRPASGELEEGSGGPCYVSQIILFNQSTGRCRK
jgi:hypothetical protein